MNWLLFLIVIGPQGPMIGNDGRPIARTPDLPHCEAIGASVAAVLNAAQTPGFTFNYSCFEERGA